MNLREKCSDVLEKDLFIDWIVCLLPRVDNHLEGELHYDIFPVYFYGWIAGNFPNYSWEMIRLYNLGIIKEIELNLQCTNNFCVSSQLRMKYCSKSWYSTAVIHWNFMNFCYMQFYPFFPLLHWQKSVLTDLLFPRVNISEFGALHLWKTLCNT